MSDKTVKLPARKAGHVWLTIRDGVVVGAMGSDPSRYMGLSESDARYLARYGAAPKITKTNKAWDKEFASGIAVPSNPSDSWGTEYNAMVTKPGYQCAGCGREILDFTPVYARKLPGQKSRAVFCNKACYKAR